MNFVSEQSPKMNRPARLAAPGARAATPWKRRASIAGGASDSLERLKTLTDPANGITEYSYDNRDNLIALKDPKGDIKNRKEISRSFSSLE